MLQALAIQRPVILYFVELYVYTLCLPNAIIGKVPLLESRVPSLSLNRVFSINELIFRKFGVEGGCRTSVSCLKQIRERAT